MTKLTWILKLALTLILTIGLLAGHAAQADGEISDKNNDYLPLPDYKAPPKATSLDKKIISILKEHNLVGVSIAAFQGNKIIFSGGYGWADIKMLREVTPDTVFRAASISKMVTATALMQLYEQDKFHLDDDISEYLGYQVRNPNYPDVKITFRHLFTHTSSIADSSMYNQIIEQLPELFLEIDIKDMLIPNGQYYSPDVYKSYAPGEKFDYSNLASCLQGALVEVIAKMPFDEYCNKHIFAPLDMDASFKASDIKNWTKTGVLYLPDKDFSSFLPVFDDFQGIKPEHVQRFAPLGSALSVSPAGGLRASVLDIAKFMMAHMNKGSYKSARILNADTADMMHNLEWFGYGFDGFYKQKGLNFHVTDDFVPGQRFIGHSAEAYGLIGDAYFDPDKKFGIVFLINGGRYTDENPFFSVESDIAKTIYKELAPKSAEKRRKIRGKVNSLTMTVNDRKLFLPVVSARQKTGDSSEGIIFVPEITVADALKVLIEINEENNALTFAHGINKVELTVNKAEMVVNGKKIPLPVAPYQSEGHIMTPIKEIAKALKVNADISF